MNEVDALDALKTQVTEMGRPELLPLDNTYESLDRLEAAFGLVLDRVAPVDDLDIFATRVARYLGRTFQKHMGGNWELCDDPQDINYGLPWLTDFEGLAGFGWCPQAVVSNYEGNRRPGLLRSATEAVAHDIKGDEGGE